MIRSVARVAGPSAIAGGALWAFGAVGWLLTHGTQVNPSEARLLGLRGTEFTQILAVATLLWLIALAGSFAGSARLARTAWALAVMGVVMIGVGAVFETSILDPDANFRHPIVQSGWLLFLFGLVPTLSFGMLGLAAWTRDRRSIRTASALIGAAAPLPVVAFTIGGIAAEGAGFVVALALLHAAPGIGWIVFGLARRRVPSVVPEPAVVMAA